MITVIMRKWFAFARRLAASVDERNPLSTKGLRLLMAAGLCPGSLGRLVSCPAPSTPWSRTRRGSRWPRSTRVWRGLGEANLWTLSDAELLELRADLETTRARLDAQVLAATREVDGRGAAVATGAASTAAWLRHKLLLHPGGGEGRGRAGEGPRR